MKTKNENAIDPHRLFLNGLQQLISKGKPAKCLHVTTHPQSNSHMKGIVEVDEREVRVLAITAMYAMVRRPGAYPYVAQTKYLEPLTTPPPAQ